MVWQIMKHLTDFGLVAPDYTGNTIANLPATIAALFGIRGPGLPPLRKTLWEPLLDGGAVRRVVLILVDGMGQNLMHLREEDVAWLAQSATVRG